MNLKYFLSVIFIFTFLKGNSQISVPGIPESFQLKNKAAIVLPFKTLELIDTAKLRAEDFDNGITNRYAIAKEISLDVKNEGVKTTIPGKGIIWQYRLQSPLAYSIGIQFSKFKLPKGASIFIYNYDHSQVIGAFTGLNNNSSNQLSIEEFPGNNATIEYFEPLNAEFSGELFIGYVLQSYRDIFTILSTSTDNGINCPTGADWQAQKHAVCRITFVDNFIGYYCSGSFVNNAKNDEKPYFLTANHCVSLNKVANTMVFYFNFEAKNCGDTTSIKPWQTLSGASLVATNSTSDFCLTLLSRDIPSSYNAYLAGWDRSVNIPQNGTCIHQPGGRSKCIALDYSSLTSNFQALNWQDENGQYINTSNANTHWLVQFSVGTIEGGSSGSPLFNEKKRIVGQLHGGNSPNFYFGKFILSWNSSANNLQQLAAWLDPDNTGVMILDGIKNKPLPVAEFSTPLTKVCINTPVQFYDKSQFKPVRWLWFAYPKTYEFVNGTDSTSQNPQISFLNNSSYTVTLTSINPNGSNSNTKSNFINVGNIDVKFLKSFNDTFICGYKFQDYPFIASGASKYKFNIEPLQKFDSLTNIDTLKLTLKSKVGSFETFIKVRGEQGNCFATDSLNFNIVIPKNDDIANSIALGLGENGPYSNNCATVELSEPHPITSGCTYIDSWCPSATALHNTIWFTFTGPPDGEITINTRGFDDRIAIYDDSSSYKIIAANDNRSENDSTAYLENMKVTPGKIYWLQLDGNNGASGNCILDLYSNNIEVYPNPNKGTFNFSIYIEGTSEANIEIFTLYGQLIFSKKVIFLVESSPFSIDIPTISSGLYIVKVNTGYNTYSKKILVIREKNH